jgi:glycosyltransferase involved in cell wall biosynthesis
MVFAAWFPKLTGTPVILDIHDIVPELYASKFGALDTSKLVRGLKWVEKLSAAFADHVIIANDLWREKFVARSAPNEKCSVFINHVDANIFYPRARTSAPHKGIILFPGGLQWHQGVDVAIRAFQKLAHRLPHLEFHIYGDGIMKPELKALVRDLSLDDRVLFFDSLGLHQIAEVMAGADLGVVPKRADSFGNEAYSTKIMEFMAVGVPVVVSSTKVDRFYFNDSVVRFFESGSVDALADAMHSVLTNRALRCDMIANALEYVANNNWELRKADYLRLVDSL